MSAIGKVYNRILTYGLQSKLISTDIEEGKLRYAYDTGNLYHDIKGKRVKISDIIPDYTEDQLSELLSPLTGKVYIASDTHRAYIYTGTQFIDLAAINLTVATETDRDEPLWFGTISDEGPSYNTDFTYNPGTKVLKVSKVNIGGMLITTSTDSSGNHTTTFSYA